MERDHEDLNQPKDTNRAEKQEGDNKRMDSQSQILLGWSDPETTYCLERAGQLCP